MIQLGSVNLIVNDLEAAERCYAEVLGLTVDPERRATVVQGRVGPKTRGPSGSWGEVRDSCARATFVWQDGW